MPVQRNSKAFKDLSASFKINPLKRDLIELTNENAIARSIRNLLLTIPGEKPFNPALGSNISNLLFGQIDSRTASSIQSEIVDTIELFEPRVELIDVRVKADPDKYRFDCKIQYITIGIDVPAQELSVALEPTR